MRSLAFVLCEGLGDRVVELIGKPISGSFAYQPGDDILVDLFVQIAFEPSDLVGTHQVEIMLERRDGEEAAVLEERRLDLWEPDDLEVDRVADLIFALRFEPVQDVAATLALDVSGQRLAHRSLDFRGFSVPDVPPAY